MKSILKVVIISISALLAASSYSSAVAPKKAIMLDGNHLTIEQLVTIARYHRPVTLDQGAMDRVKRSHQLVILAASKNLPVYGLNRGVGLNKDKNKVTII